MQYRGFIQGLVPTTARQAANSATRFGSYTALRQLAQSYVAPGEKLGPLSTFGIGAVAGLITVYAFFIYTRADEAKWYWRIRYCTQPLDSIKTRYVVCPIPYLLLTDSSGIECNQYQLGPSTRIAFIALIEYSPRKGF
jgi:hypothetical protein